MDMIFSNGLNPLTSCQSLQVTVSLPVNTVTTIWECQPASSPFCQALKRITDARAKADFINMPESDVVAASEAIRQADPQATLVEVSISVEARDTPVGIGSFLARTGDVVLQFDVMPTDRFLVVKDGPRSWTLADKSLDLQVGAVSCEGSGSGGASPKINWQVRQAGAAENAWRLVTSLSQSATKLKLSPSTFTVGDWQVRATLEDTDPPADVVVDIGILPIPAPVAVIAAPPTATPSCALLLDASASSDPGATDAFETLTYAWICDAVPETHVQGVPVVQPQAEDVAACWTMSMAVTTSQFTVPGGQLGKGHYRFTVLVTRVAGPSPATSNTSVVVEFTDTGGPKPVVSLSVPSPEVSPQLSLYYEATVLESGDCVAPPNRSWCLLGVDKNDVPRTDAGGVVLETMLGTQGPYKPAPSDDDDGDDGPFEYSVALNTGRKPLGAAPGMYKLRLVLSSGTVTGCEGDEAQGIFVFDSYRFMVDSPPTSGECSVFPTTGNIATQTFQIQSKFWEDDDTPLKHRFAWRPGSDPEAAGGGKWTIMSDWSQAESIERTFGTVGALTARAEVKDTLGSISAAYAQVELVKPETVEVAALNSVLDNAVASGDTFLMLSTVKAVADAGEGSAQDAAGTAALQSKALSTLSGAIGTVDEASPETVAASSDALAGVVSAFVIGAPAPPPPAAVVPGEPTPAPTPAPTPPPVSYKVANQAADLVGDIASSAARLEEGLEPETAGALVNTIDALMGASIVDEVAATPSSDLSGDADSSSDSVAQADTAAAQAAEVSRQQAMSDKLQAAISSTGDAVLTAAEEGVEVEISSPTGMQLKVKKESTDKVGEFGADVGGFNIPPLGNGTARRLASTCPDGKAMSIGMQNIKYRGKNPYAYAGSKGRRSKNTTDEEKPKMEPELNGTQFVADIIEGDIDVVDDDVQTMNLRMCGQTMEVSNLKENITFWLNISSRNNSNATFFEEPRCMYFDEVNLTWTDKGCKVLKIEDTRIMCGCSHLSSFSVGFSSFIAIIKEAVQAVYSCSNVDVLSPKSLENILKGNWWYGMGAILLWVVLLLYFIILAKVQRVNHRNIKDMGVRRLELMSMVAKSKLSSEEDDQKSWTRMQQAAKEHGRNRHFAKAVWFFQKLFLGRDAHLEDHLMKSPRDGLLIALLLKFATLVIITDMNVFKQDAPRAMMLGDQAGNKAQESRQDSKADEHMSSMRDGVKKLKAKMKSYAARGIGELTSVKSTAPRIAILMRAHHPIAQAMTYSMSAWWALRMVSLANSILGSMAVTSMWMGGTAVSNDSDPECSGSFMKRVLMDIMISLFGSFISLLPVLVLTTIHTREVRWIEDPVARRRSLNVRLYMDYFLLICAYLWFSACVLVVMAFLANVSLADQHHWVVAAFTALFKTFLLMPLLVSLVWELINRLVTVLFPYVVELAEPALGLLLNIDADDLRLLTSDGSSRPLQLQLEAHSQFRDWAHDWVKDQWSRPVAGATLTDMRSSLVHAGHPLPPTLPPPPPGGAWKTLAQPPPPPPPPPQQCGVKQALQEPLSPLAPPPKQRADASGGASATTPEPDRDRLQTRLRELDTLVSALQALPHYERNTPQIKQLLDKKLFERDDIQQRLRRAESNKCNTNKTESDVSGNSGLLPPSQKGDTNFWDWAQAMARPSGHVSAASTVINARRMMMSMPPPPPAAVGYGSVPNDADGSQAETAAQLPQLLTRSYPSSPVSEPSSDAVGSWEQPPTAPPPQPALRTLPPALQQRPGAGSLHPGATPPAPPPAPQQRPGAGSLPPGDAIPPPPAPQKRLAAGSLPPGPPPAPKQQPAAGSLHPSATLPPPPPAPEPQPAGAGSLPPGALTEPPAAPQQQPGAGSLLPGAALPAPSPVPEQRPEVAGSLPSQAAGSLPSVAALPAPQPAPQRRTDVAGSLHSGVAPEAGSLASKARKKSVSATAKRNQRLKELVTEARRLKEAAETAETEEERERLQQARTAIQEEAHALTQEQQQQQAPVPILSLAQPPLPSRGAPGPASRSSPSGAAMETRAPLISASPPPPLTP